MDVSISLPSKISVPFAIPLAIAGPGHYYAYNVDIPVAGTWILRFTVRTDAIDEQVVTYVPYPSTDRIMAPAFASYRPH